MSFGARALIRLGALTHNLQKIRQSAPGAKVMAVIKANAYGHGMVAVAKNLPDVDAFAVARVSEAIELRQNGITTDIVLLAGVLNEEELRSAIEWNFQLVVHCEEQLDLITACNGSSITTWLKVDTGMNRLGFHPDDVPELLSRLRKMHAVREVRLMTHLSSADELENDVTTRQFNRFVETVDDSISDVSISNSAGVFGWPSLQTNSLNTVCNNWIRPGIVMFGISPFADKTGIDLGLKPVMQFEARLIAKKSLSRDAYVGYKRAYRNQEGTTLGLISAGYGDGYSRHFKTGTPVIINGRRVPVIGNVSMDIIAVDLGNGAADSVGDIATLWGDGLPVEEVAPWANAIPYELVCGVMNREASQIAD